MHACECVLRERRFAKQKSVGGEREGGDTDRQTSKKGERESLTERGKEKGRLSRRESVRK